MNRSRLHFSPTALSSSLQPWQAAHAHVSVTMQYNLVLAYSWDVNRHPVRRTGSMSKASVCLTADEASFSATF